MTRTRLILCAALAVCVWLTACGPNWHSIILTPNGPVMERKIVQRFGPEELERVAMLYSEKVDAETLAKFEDNSESEVSLTGVFEKVMPTDSRNSGVYLYCDSPLGSAAVYTERFGGRHDVAAMLRGQEKAFNLLGDIVLLQLDALAGDSPDYAALRTFLDTTVRADMWDLTLEVTVADLGKDSMSNLSWRQDSPDDTSPMLMRALHFLDERGYVTLQESLDQLNTADFEDEVWTFGITFIGKAIGRRMGLEHGAMPAAFEALLNYTDEQLERELEQVRTNDQRVTRLLADFREDFDGMSAASPSSSMSVLAKQAFLFDFDLLDIAGDARRVILQIPVEPYMTNGAWFEEPENGVADNEDGGGDSGPYVEWSYPLADGDALGGDLAQVVFAFWAEPAEDYQVEHFGFRVLSDSQLAEHCRWRELLGPSLRNEWDAFIDSLRPGPDLESTLLGFRFSIEQADQADADAYASDSWIAKGVLRTLASNVRREQSPD